MAVALPFIAVGLSAVAAQQQYKAGKEAKKQYQAQQRIAEVENMYKVRQQVRAARLAQASMVNTAAQTGGMGGSGLAGGLSSTASQLRGNLGMMSDIADQQTAINNAAINEAGNRSNAAIYGAVGQMAGTIYSYFSGPKPAAAPDAAPVPGRPRGGS